MVLEVRDGQVVPFDETRPLRNDDPLPDVEDRKIELEEEEDAR